MNGLGKELLMARLRERRRIIETGIGGGERLRLFWRFYCSGD